MSASFRLERARGVLLDAKARAFDPLSRRWTADSTPAKSTDQFDAVDACTAVTWLQRDSGHPLRIPIGVIGPRDASDAQLAAALRVGELLADCGLVVICGGRQGVMQAVCEGVARVGGLSLGLLPETDATAANSFVSVAIATGIGEARNALIARAAYCLIAIGDSFGTLSEVALARQFGKLVVGLEGAADVDGVEHLRDAEAAVQRVAEAILTTD